MREFRDKVAVITGAASGIGRAVAERCVKEGMRVVLADVEEDALTRAEAAMSDTGATVLAVPTDVSAASDVEALAQKTLEAFGAVHLVHNNAGVVVGGRVWENTVDDWAWVMGVNMWGVIHGIRVFVPLMLEQNTEGHIVNTASMVGLISGPGFGIYKVTKHGVVALSETLHYDLGRIEAKIGVSVLCPGLVRTQIIDSDRNRAASLGNAVAQQDTDMTVGALSREEFRQARQAVEEGMPPDEVAEHVFDAITEERLYILTHPDAKDRVRARMDAILEERNPSSP